MVNAINIVGVKYSVDLVEEIDNNPNLMGACIYQKSLIQIRKGMSLDKQQQTLLHEILHACLNEAGYTEQDEDLVNRLGIILYQVLKENEIKFNN